MSTEKMRGEFEAWCWREYREVYWYDLDQSHVFQPYKGAYKTEFLNVRWESWQASRAAIEVELPALRSITMGRRENDHDSGFNDGVELCVDAIESLGLKVKP